MSFPRYPAYKDSGVEWLGDVPAHWEVRRLGSLFRETADEGEDGLPILSVSIHDGVSDKELSEDELDRKVTRSEDTAKYKQVHPQDLVYNMMRAWQGGFGTVLVPGLVSPAYVVARPIANVHTRYIENLLRTSGAVEEMRRHSHGVTDFRLRLYWDEFKSIQVCLPDIAEQSAILRFLDREAAKIDELVSEQEKVIGLLNEKRQALVRHTVTKGLNPASLMKDPGMDWVGEMPAHWAAVPLKYVASFASGGTPSKEREEYWEGAIPWASAKDMKVEFLLDTEDHISDAALNERAASLIAARSVIVVVRGMILARTFPVCVNTVPMAINQDLKAIIAEEQILPEYLAWYLRGTSDESLRRLDEAAHGTKALRMDKWTSLPICVPPRAEQASIVSFLNGMTSRIDGLVSEAQKAIVLLKERRAALISAAVAGKIDVRSVSVAA